eukprot:SAG22_NODE_285_length_12974_cov_2.969087_5_plen_92_part_00
MQHLTPASRGRGGPAHSEPAPSPGSSEEPARKKTKQLVGVVDAVSVDDAYVGGAAGGAAGPATTVGGKGGKAKVQQPVQQRVLDLAGNPDD